MGRRRFLVAVGLLAAYVVVLGFTVALRDDHVRPLYDGFAPPPPYSWVDPPSFFESGNVEPAERSARIRVGSEGSAPAGVATPDGQFVLNLGRGAIPAREGTRAATVQITPLAADDLAPLPAGLRANGNAYRLRMAYADGAKVRPLTSPGTLVVEIPELGDDLFFSADGRRWSELEATPVPPRQLSLTAPVDRAGYYLAGTNLPELVGTTSGSDHSVAIGIGTAALTAILLVGAFLLVRRRRRRERSVTKGDATLP